MEPGRGVYLWGWGRAAATAVSLGQEITQTAVQSLRERSQCWERVRPQNEGEAPVLGKSPSPFQPHSGLSFPAVAQGEKGQAFELSG